MGGIDLHQVAAKSLCWQLLYAPGVRPSASTSELVLYAPTASLPFPPGSDLHPPHTAAAHTYFDHFDRQVANYHRRTRRLKSALRPCAKALLCPTLDAVRSVRQQQFSMMPSRQVTYYLWCSVECCGPQSTMHVGGGRRVVGWRVGGVCMYG